MNFVFDACALIAFLRGEVGSEVVESILISYENYCLVHAINLCEVYYDFIRAQNEEVALEAVNDLISIGIIVRDYMDFSFWQEAGRIKAKNNMSLADCFAIATAIREKATFVTSDHREFDQIVRKGSCPVDIYFIR